MASVRRFAPERCLEWLDKVSRQLSLWFQVREWDFQPRSVYAFPWWVTMTHDTLTLPRLGRRTKAHGAILHIKRKKITKSSGAESARERGMRWSIFKRLYSFILLCRCSLFCKLLFAVKLAVSLQSSLQPRRVHWTGHFTVTEPQLNPSRSSTSRDRKKPLDRKMRRPRTHSNVHRKVLRLVISIWVTNCGKRSSNL